MAEIFRELPLAEGVIRSKDDYVDMTIRRHFSNQYAAEPMDSYDQGMKAALRYIKLTPASLVLDIGCSSGAFILEAVQNNEISAYVAGLDKDGEAHRLHFPKEFDRSRFSFFEGCGEDIPLPDDSADVIFVHNTLFRGDAPMMLDEVKRVGKPNSIVGISTNGRRHARYRHLIEWLAARQIRREVYPDMTVPRPPADGAYLEDLPDLIHRCGGLEIVEQITQDTYTKITPDRMGTYRTSLKYSMNYTNLPDKYRDVWEQKVEALLSVIAGRTMAQMDAFNREHGISARPYFADAVHRGLLVLRNVK